MRGAGDTVRSIIISANSRLAFLETKQVLRLLSKDELNLSDIGIGVKGDGETKTAPVSYTHLGRKRPQNNKVWAESAPKVAKWGQKAPPLP